MLYGDTGWLSDKYQKYLSMLIFWNRLIRMPNDRVAKKIFHLDYKNERDNWCSDGKTILFLLHISDIYQNQHPRDLTLSFKKLESLCELQ